MSCFRWASMLGSVQRLEETMVFEAIISCVIHLSICSNTSFLLNKNQSVECCWFLTICVWKLSRSYSVFQSTHFPLDPIPLPDGQKQNFVSGKPQKAIFSWQKSWPNFACNIRTNCREGQFGHRIAIMLHSQTFSWSHFGFVCCWTCRSSQSNQWT